MAELKRQIEQGEYRVDPVRVADAMLTWPAPPAGEDWRYVECSYPDSSWSGSPSGNNNPGGPSTTSPTKMVRVFVPALAGMHAQSS